MSVQLSDNEIILVRDESTVGEDGVGQHLKTPESGISSGENIDVYFQEVNDFSISLNAINDSPERKTWSADSSKRPFVKHNAEVEVEVPLTASTTKGGTTNYDKSADNLPAYNHILQAMNLSENTTPTSPEFQTATDRQTTVTFYQIIRNARDSQERLRRIRGVVGNGEFNISTGEEPTISFSGMGYYDKITGTSDYVDPTNTDADPLIAETYDGTVLDYDDAAGSDGTATYHPVDETPLIPKAMTLELSGGTNISGATTFDVSDLSFDLGWTQDGIDVLTNKEGEMEHINTRGAGEGVTGSFTLQDYGDNPQTNFDDLISDYENADQLKLKAVLKEVNGTRTVEIIMPNIQLGVESEGENGNLMQHDFDFVANRDLGASKTGDNSIKIIYTV